MRRIARPDVNPAPAFAVNVLGQVGQQREVTEGPDDGQRDRDIDVGIPISKIVAVEFAAPDAEGVASRTLDEIEDVVAGVGANGVTEDGAEQADVVAERLGQ